MCFSATASFAAAAVLTPIGVYTMYKARPKERLFAAIPLLFAVQQVFEGIQWLAVGQGTVCMPAGYGFLLFALFVWPLIVPAAAIMMEPDAKRRADMRWTQYLGAVVAAAFLILCSLRSMAIVVFEKSLWYDLGYSWQVLGTVAAFYIVAVCLPMVRSSHFWLRVFGFAIFAAAMLSSIFFLTTFTSVWCFFSACLSAVVLGYFVTKKAPSKKGAPALKR